MPRKNPRPKDKKRRANLKNLVAKHHEYQRQARPILENPRHGDDRKLKQLEEKIYGQEDAGTYLIRSP